MSKRTGENQDYYKHAGQDVGRRILDREKRKVSEARAQERAPRSPRIGEPASQTAERGRKVKQQREAERVEHDEVSRMLEAEVPAAPPQRQLPAASVSTELEEIWRSVEQSSQTILRASRDLVRSLGELMRAPVRLVRVLRASA